MDDSCVPGAIFADFWSGFLRRAASRTEERLRLQIEAPKQDQILVHVEPMDAAQSVSDYTHAVGTRPTQASEHGRRRRVSPFASVGGMPGPSIRRELCFEQARASWILLVFQNTYDMKRVFGCSGFARPWTSVADGSQNAQVYTSGHFLIDKFVCGSITPVSLFTRILMSGIFHHGGTCLCRRHDTTYCSSMCLYLCMWIER